MKENKDVQWKYMEDSTTLLKNIKEELSGYRNILWSKIGQHNIVKILVLSKLIYGFH